MDHTRRAVRAVVGFTAFVFLVRPVSAQTGINDALIGQLNAKLLYIAVPITLLVEGLLIYAVWRFAGNETPQPTQENRRLEITWTVATAIVLLFVGFASYQVLAAPAIGGVGHTVTDSSDRSAAVSQDYTGAVGPRSGEDAVEIEVVAEKYTWTFNYPASNVSSGGILVLPANRTLYLHVTSTDWIHSLHVPALALKQDAFPGQYNTIKTEVYQRGTYQLYCAEYCGVGHSAMTATVRVVGAATFQSWLDQQQTQAGGNRTAGTPTPDGSAAGNTSAIVQRGGT